MPQIKSIIQKTVAFLAIPVIVYIAFIVVRPAVFLRWGTCYSVLMQSCIVCIMAWGISFSLTAGIMDFSLAAERILGSIIGVLLSRTMGISGLIIGCMAVAVVCGAIKAVLNSQIKMSSMVISVAYVLILGAVGALIQGSNSMILRNEMCVLGKSPWIWIILAVCGVIMYVLQRYSVFGANCRALGGSNKIAGEAGVSKGRTEGKAIMIASLFVGISGIVATSYGAGTVASTGLNSIAVVFPAIIGFYIGRILEQYVNITFGCIAGVVTMNILATGLISVGMPSQLKDTVTGGFLLGLMCLTSLLDKRRADVLRRQASKITVRA